MSGKINVKLLCNLYEVESRRDLSVLQRCILYEDIVQLRGSCIIVENKLEGNLSNLVEGCTLSSETEWASALKPFQGATVEIAFDTDFKPEENDSFVLGVGLEFGNSVDDHPEPIRYSGSAKILAVG